MSDNTTASVISTSDAIQESTQSPSVSSDNNINTLQPISDVKADVKSDVTIASDPATMNLTEQPSEAQSEAEAASIVTEDVSKLTISISSEISSTTKIASKDNTWKRKEAKVSDSCIYMILLLMVMYACV